MSFTTGPGGPAPYHANDHHTDISKKHQRPETTWEEFERLRATIAGALPSDLLADFTRLLEVKDELAAAANQLLKTTNESLSGDLNTAQEAYAELLAENKTLREKAEKVDDADVYLAQAERDRAEAKENERRSWTILKRLRDERGI